VLREVERHTDARERCPELVRHVGEELRLRAEELRHPVGHLVECAGDGAQLVAALPAGSGRQVAGAERAVCLREPIERARDGAAR
jgi:hypothetical protein